MMVIDDDQYGERVPIQVGTLHIDEMIKVTTKDEFDALGQEWDRARFSSFVGGRSISVGEGDSFSLSDVKGPVKLTKDVTLQPFEAVRVQGLTKVRGHLKRVHSIIEPKIPEDVNPGLVAAVTSYTILKPGSSKVTLGLKNFSCRVVTLRAKAIVATISAANAIPAKLAPKTVADEKEEERGAKPPPLSQEQVNALLEKLDYVNPQKEQKFSEDAQKDALLFLKEYGAVFALKDMDLGKTSIVKHKINLTDYVPFKERYRRIPPHQYDEVKKHLKEMLAIGAIRKSNSPWASAVVLVRKKDGSLRFCIDLRKLNARTIRDAYGLPRIDETLDSLKGALLFSSLDLKAGYWQVEMDEDSKALTAFTVGPLGFYECERMPFGLTNAPATFQRLMESCLGDLHLNWCIIYLDDVIVYSRTPQEHLERLRAVFQRLWEAGLKLKPSKCEFFKSSISYLGHIVSKDGIGTDPKKVSAIENWSTPQTVTDVRSFLGFTNHYRRFIKRYAHIARPLNKLTSGENSKFKKKKIEWSPECEQAFQELKQLCSTTPVLAYADYTQKFLLSTDASELGLGAVLYQIHDGEKKVVAYASRALSPSERNYPAHKLEFLALKWAVTDHFHEYLYGGVFEVYTDNNPLTYILTTAKLDATGQRWVARLANYNFSLHYKSGKTNVDADALSRCHAPWKEQKTEWDETINQAAVNAIICACGVNSRSNTAVSFSPALSDVELVWAYQSEEIGMRVLSKAGRVIPEGMTNEEWIKEQKADPLIGEIRQLLVNRTLTKRKGQRGDTELMKQMLKHRQQYVLRNNLVFRRVKSTKEGPPTMQFLLPPKFRERALEACHDDIGHLGLERCVDLLRDRFFWVSMAADMEKKIKNCERCLKFKATPQKSPLCPLLVTHPFELVHMDYLKIESNRSDQDVHILIVTDHFTRFAQAFITPNETARVVARTLWDQYFMKYGIPEKLISDQGRNFESDLIAELCNLSRVQKLRTSPYRPQTNGQCERFNSTLIGMIGTLPPETKRNWQEQIATLVHGYNCTKSNATGFKPYTLMFGREPLLPIDVEFGVRTPDVAAVTTHKYIRKLKNRMEWAFKKAAEVSLKESTRHKRYYDKKVKCSKLEPGDMVLVRQKAFKGKHKIQDKWENVPYMVIEQVDPKLPVFRVESTGEKPRSRVLHRNMLFPLLTQDLDKAQSFENDVSEQAPVENGALDDRTEDIDSSDDISESPDPADEPYTGPVTRSRAKGTAAFPVDVAVKANKLMEEHFEVITEDTTVESDSIYFYMFALFMSGFLFIRQWMLE